jgi:mannose-6-phosphate isomerase
MTESTVSHESLSPVILGANQPDDRPYRGGLGIALFRHVPQRSEFVPEDFVASTTEVFAGGGVGLSRLPDGTLLRDAVRKDPVGYLGAEHVAAFGAESSLLVKILDTQERLFVHYHPDDAFAGAELNQPRGKTEAWVVIDVRSEAGEDAFAWIGFRRPVRIDELEDWVLRQDAPAMLEAMNKVPLRPGDTLAVPAGLPHAIGPGVTLVELQQPSDLSVLLEHSGFHWQGPVDPFLGLGIATALAGVGRDTLTDDAIAELQSRSSDRVGVERILPTVVDPFFRCEWVRSEASASSLRLEPGFAVLVVLKGSGRVDWKSGELEVMAGQTVLVPHAAGELHVSGDLTVLACRPPAASSR